MEFSYDDYIIMASKYNLRSDYQAYLLHKEGLKFLNQLVITA